MAYEILMPALSPTMTEGSIVKWHKNEGDVVKASEILLEVETDKATMEVEAVDEGILRKIFSHSGIVSVGTCIGLIAQADEDISSYVPTQKQNEINEPTDIKESTKVKLDNEKTTDIKESTKVTLGNEKTCDKEISCNRIIASPLAKKIASIINVSLAEIKGSGPKGRIIKKDVENYKKDAKEDRVKTKQVASVLKPFSMVQKVIAKRLLESKQTIPHFYLSIDIVLDELLNFKKQIEEKISINDFIIKASALSLQKVPEVNVSFENDGILQHFHSDISVAVAIDSGLITPIVKEAENKTILEISKEVKDLVLKAKSNSLKPEEFQGGSFTISNLGMFKINSFQAIINPPQAAILAVGAGTKKVISENDMPIIKTVMNVNLSLDHRLISGAEAAKFLNHLKDMIEKPYKMFI